jgi:hypothetical protein
MSLTSELLIAHERGSIEAEENRREDYGCTTQTRSAGKDSLASA